MKRFKKSIRKYSLYFYELFIFSLITDSAIDFLVVK